MNRRQFTQRLAAIAASPALHTGLMGATTTKAATSALPAINPFHWGAFMARTRGEITPAILQNDFYISDDMAAEVMQHLVDTKIVAPLNARGIYTALDPLMPPIKFPHLAKTAPSKKLSEWLDDGEEAPEDTPEDDVETIEEPEIEATET